MFDSQQKSTGTQYTTTVTLLLVAFVFIPAVLIASRPVGYVSLGLAIACSGLCAAFAWVRWRWHSQLTIPSLEAPSPRSK